MGKFIDLTGNTYGRLTVVRRSSTPIGNKIGWECICSCGNKKIVRGSDLTMGRVVSCGCYHSEKLGNMRRTHGRCNTDLYIVWKGMRQRCHDSNYKEYNNYGGKGVVICDSWNNFDNFYDWAITSGYKKGLTIDRIDNNLGYNPDNCRWATPAEQSVNKTNNRNLTYNGETHCIAEWARILKVPYETLRSRLDRGWSIDKALKGGR